MVSQEVGTEKGETEEEWARPTGVKDGVRSHVKSLRIGFLSGQDETVYI